MESSEEGTTRLPYHSDVGGPSEHWARSQKEHRLLHDPAVEWGPGRPLAWGGSIYKQAHTGHVGEAEHLPRGLGQSG